MNREITSTTKPISRQLALKNYLTTPQVRSKILAMLPTLAKQSGTTPEQMIGTVLIACAKQPALLDCSPDSILRALLQCAELGLVAGGITGEAYLIPYGRDGKECQLQIGYRGFQRLAFATGRITKIEGRVVYEAEMKQGKFKVTYEPETKVFHEPEFMEELGRVMAAYAKVSFQDTEPQYEILRREDIEKIRRQADRVKPSLAWKDWADQMAIKAAIKRLCKRLDLSSNSSLVRAAYLDDRMETAELSHDGFSPFDEPSMEPASIENEKEEMAVIESER